MAGATGTARTTTGTGTARTTTGTTTGQDHDGDDDRPGPLGRYDLDCLAKPQFTSSSSQVSTHILDSVSIGKSISSASKTKKVSHTFSLILFVPFERRK